MTVTVTVTEATMVASANTLVTPGKVAMDLAVVNSNEHGTVGFVGGKPRTTVATMKMDGRDGWRSEPDVARADVVGRLNGHRRTDTLKKACSKHAGRARSSLLTKWIASRPMNEQSSVSVELWTNWSMGAGEWRTTEAASRRVASSSVCNLRWRAEAKADDGRTVGTVSVLPTLNKRTDGGKQPWTHRCGTQHFGRWATRPVEVELDGSSRLGEDCGTQSALSRQQDSRVCPSLSCGCAVRVGARGVHPSGWTGEAECLVAGVRRA